MRFDITFRNLESSRKIINYIEHKISLTFSRSKHKIEEAKIILSDINGPKGGIDKQCQIILTLARSKPIVVSETQENFHQAIGRCFYRASQCLNRKLKRRQMLLKKRNQQAA